MAIPLENKRQADIWTDLDTVHKELSNPVYENFDNLSKSLKDFKGNPAIKKYLDLLQNEIKESQNTTDLENGKPDQETTLGYQDARKHIVNLYQGTMGPLMEFNTKLQQGLSNIRYRINRAEALDGEIRKYVRNGGIVKTAESDRLVEEFTQEYGSLLQVIKQVSKDMEEDFSKLLRNDLVGKK